eukprot:1156904-Pelagomonas_calceolata.AAC.6
MHAAHTKNAQSLSIGQQSGGVGPIPTGLMFQWPHDPMASCFLLREAPTQQQRTLPGRTQTLLSNQTKVEGKDKSFCPGPCHDGMPEW